jgi:hypothetical protein
MMLLSTSQFHFIVSKLEVCQELIFLSMNQIREEVRWSPWISCNHFLIQ